MNAHHITLTPVKTYATRENAIKAVEKVYGPNCGHFGGADLRYLVLEHTDGRFYPVFIGQSALHHGVHFRFNVLAV